MLHPFLFKFTGKLVYAWTGQRNYFRHLVPMVYTYTALFAAGLLAILLHVLLTLWAWL